MKGGKKKIKDSALKIVTFYYKGFFIMCKFDMLRRLK